MGAVSKAFRHGRGRVDLALYTAGLRSRGGLVLPAFLGIGAQKAGTTWLHENLVCHPELYLPPEKELHHFDWFRQGTLVRYAEHFRTAGDRLPGEITPGYSALRGRRIQAVRAVVPDVRLLLLLRDPVERAWSQVCMDLRQAGRSVDDVPDDEILRHLDRRGARRRGEYVDTLAAWESAFPRRLWVGFFEDVATRPKEVLVEVFEHLGVATDVAWETFPYRQAFNAGRHEEIRPTVRSVLAATYEPDIRQLRERLGDRVTSWGAR